MNRTTSKFALFVALILVFHQPSMADEPEKYALLIAVKEYQQPEVNSPPLTYTEIDANSVGALLRKSGYVVDLVLGDDATRDKIEKKLNALKNQGIGNGTVLIGLFGHGMQFTETKVSRTIAPMALASRYC